MDVEIVEGSIHPTRNTISRAGKVVEDGKSLVRIEALEKNKVIGVSEIEK